MHVLCGACDHVSLTFCQSCTNTSSKFSNSCSAVPYTGVCKEHLLDWQSCTIGHSIGSAVFVSATNISLLENNASLFMEKIGMR